MRSIITWAISSNLQIKYTRHQSILERQKYQRAYIWLLIMKIILFLLFIFSFCKNECKVECENCCRNGECVSKMDCIGFIFYIIFGVGGCCMFCLCLVLMRFCYKQFSQRQAVEDFKEQKEIQQKIENETNKQVLQIS